MQSTAVEGLSDKKVFLQFEWWSDLVHLISSAGFSLKRSWCRRDWQYGMQTLRHWGPPAENPDQLRAPLWTRIISEFYYFVCFDHNLPGIMPFFFFISAMSVHSPSFLPVLFRPGKWLLVVLVLCFSTHFDAPSWLTESACSVQCTIPWLPLKCRLKWIKRLIWASVICIETPHAV